MFADGRNIPAHHPHPREAWYAKYYFPEFLTRI